MLALERPWRLIRGGTAYVPRGPIAGTDPPERLADRIRAVSDYLAGHGIAALTSDAEIRAETGYGLLLRQRGFRPTEEIQPSRHRLSVPLADGASDEASLAKLTMSARQRVRGAIKRELRVVRYDTSPSAPELPLERPPGGLDAKSLAQPFDRFYELLLETAQRRGFRMVSRERFRDWSTRAVLGGLAMFLEVRAPDGRLLGGGLFYRHGRRLTYSNAGDLAAHRREFPGVIHLLLWRAIQLAIAEGLDEVDLGGVDVKGARRRPVEGEAMHGLLSFKESFGGQWIELAGNHIRVAHRLPYYIGSASSRLFSLVGRRAG